MAKKRTRRQKAILKRRIFLGLCAGVLVIALTALCLTVVAIVKAFDTAPEGGSEPQTSQNSDTDAEPTVKSHTTVLSTGDIMVHSTQLDGAHTSDGGYDFSAFFKNIKDYVSKADLAVANLEVTFGGNEGRSYSGYPGFNTPDVLADNLKDAGFDLLLTANNHCYDTGEAGLKRTLTVLDEKGLAHNGTRSDTSEPVFLVKKVNGIKIGMISYTYENTPADDGRKSINGSFVSSECGELINSFRYEEIDEFYTRAQSAIDGMKSAGAEFVVFYMHWGEEYQTSQNTHQKSISQRLCNMGVNMIIGGHPHVVQPIELIHSEDSQNTAVCLYSMGNAVSNQRQELMDSCPSGHTEDGMLFSYTLKKMSDGTVSLESIDLIPTWVNKYRGGSGYQYTIVPLESADDGATKWSLTGTTAERSRKSYERTKAIVKAGLDECQQSLGCEKSFED